MLIIIITIMINNFFFIYFYNLKIIIYNTNFYLPLIYTKFIKKLKFKNINFYIFIYEILY